tara:strand:+ start:97 stop:450 length:354 start_codon:yes stop_codon:yes gene_type:complete
LLLLNFAVHSHEQTPTYPTWKSSGIDGIKKTNIRIWNKRPDIEFYEIGVFEEDRETPIPFVTSYKIIPVGYLKEVKFDIYIREKNIAEARYVCSLSKLRSNDRSQALLATRICSKFK